MWSPKDLLLQPSKGCNFRVCDTRPLLHSFDFSLRRSPAPSFPSHDLLQYPVLWRLLHRLLIRLAYGTQTLVFVHSHRKTFHSSTEPVRWLDGDTYRPDCVAIGGTPSPPSAIHNNEEDSLRNRPLYRPLSAEAAPLASHFAFVRLIIELSYIIETYMSWIRNEHSGCVANQYDRYMIRRRYQ